MLAIGQEWSAVKRDSGRSTFLQRGRRRQDTTLALVNMHRVPSDRSRLPAVGAQLDRVVKRYRCLFGEAM
jgi:hypothetical protein